MDTDSPPTPSSLKEEQRPTDMLTFGLVLIKHHVERRSSVPMWWPQDVTQQGRPQKKFTGGQDQEMLERQKK